MALSTYTFGGKQKAENERTKALAYAVLSSRLRTSGRVELSTRGTSGPPATAVVFAVTLRHRRHGEPRGGDAVTGTKTRASDDIRTERSLHPTRAGGNVRTSG